MTINAAGPIPTEEETVVILRVISTAVATEAKRVAATAAKAEAAVIAEAEAVLSAAADATLATPRQVDYLVSLLCARIRSGEGGGFIQTDYLVVGGQVDVAAVRRLDRQTASMMITSLRGEY